MVQLMILPPHHLLLNQERFYLSGASLLRLPSVLLLVGRQEGHPACKNGGWWRWALVSLDGVAPSRMVSVSASANLSLHHKVQKLSSGTGSPGWSRKKCRKTVVVVLELH